MWGLTRGYCGEGRKPPNASKTAGRGLHEDKLGLLMFQHINILDSDGERKDSGLHGISLCQSPCIGDTVDLGIASKEVCTFPIYPDLDMHRGRSSFNLSYLRTT
jgi:hypothetical protein